LTVNVSGPNVKSLMVTSLPVAAGPLDAPEALDALDALDAVELLDVLAFDPESLLHAAARATTQTRPRRSERGVREWSVLWLPIKQVFGPARRNG
jgi:hypothetical protein